MKPSERCACMGLIIADEHWSFCKPSETKLQPRGCGRAQSFAHSLPTATGRRTLITPYDLALLYERHCVISVSLFTPRACSRSKSFLLILHSIRNQWAALRASAHWHGACRCDYLRVSRLFTRRILRDSLLFLRVPFASQLLISFDMFDHGPEYKARLEKPFVPPTITLKDVHDAVPKHLLRKNPWLSSYYCIRDVVCCAAIFYYGFSIEHILAGNFGGFVPLSAAWQIRVARAALWLVYWWFQGLSFAGFFCIAHELGHQTLFNNRYVNDTLGYFFHTLIMAPFFAWKASHNAHHRTVASIERDENYVPYERSDYPLPPKEKAKSVDYLEVFDETPILTLGRMLVMQGMGWWLYMTINAAGSNRYPKGTNHFSPYSPLFRPDQRLGILLSDIGILGMGLVLRRAANLYGAWAVFMYYFIPYVLCNHWIVMLTYLHHSDPTIPHYRKDEWSWVRGAAATVDRPLLGWAGRFFLHNVSHDHVAHHFFSYAPFYHQPEITRCVRKVLKDDYNYDSTNTFYALYRSFTQCIYVDDDESIVFYRNKFGESVRGVAKDKLQQVDENWNPEEQDNGTKVVE